MIKKLNDIKLIFALGNPEEKYKNTRHNIGIFFFKKNNNNLHKYNQ